MEKYIRMNTSQYNQGKSIPITLILKGGVKKSVLHEKRDQEKATIAVLTFALGK